VEVLKDIQISKYIQHSLPCVITSQMCPVHIVLLLLDIVPRASPTCKISTYIVLRHVNRASEGNYLVALGYIQGEVLDLSNHALFSVQ